MPVVITCSKHTGPRKNHCMGGSGKDNTKLAKNHDDHEWQCLCYGWYFNGIGPASNLKFSSAKWAVHILHIGNDVCIFCISCILFCIFCILHAILSNIMKTCILLTYFAYYFAYFFLHILHTDLNCIFCIFYIFIDIFCILYHILFDVFCILISIAYFAYCAY